MACVAAVTPIAAIVRATVALVAACAMLAFAPAARAQQPAPAPLVPAAPAATAADIRRLADAGRYDDAEQAARRLTLGARGAEYLTPLGDVLLARGRLASAESAFVQAIAGRAADSLTAAVRLAVLHHDRGDRATAVREFERFIDIYNGSAASLTARDLVAVAEACRYLGSRDPQLFKDALKALDRAVAMDRANADAHSALGELFLSKYNSGDAQSAFASALELRPGDPRALVGEARRRGVDGQPGADSLLARALARNPSYVPALALVARAQMGSERYGDALRTADQALAINPASPEALAVAAAVRYLTGDVRGADAVRDRARSLYPRSGDLLATMADAAGSVRRYAAAADFARQAVAVDSTNWRARGLLGMNLMRLGRIAEGRAALEASFAGDPYDVWIKNTLDLLDTFANYDTISSAHATMMIEKQESAVLAIYLGDLVDEAWRVFSARYGWAPAGRVRVEVFRSQADFSVRTVGMPGIGALGVSFGNTLAFDSPAAKDAGGFNWGSTAWHELAHTFTLGATDHRVPRWFSEGLSVWEEHKARRGWGFHVSPEFLEALHAGKLVPASRMNDGFMRPAYPGQVLLSYFEASLLCDWVAAEKGEAALVTMLREYGAGRTTEEVVARVLGVDLAAFDAKFDAYMKERFKDARPVDSDELVVRAAALAKEGRREPAIALLRSAMYDDPTNLTAHTALAGLLGLNGDTTRSAEEADVLERSLYINPFEIAVHQRLAVLFRRLGDRAKVVRERRAVVALAPVDVAEAWYELALAQYEASDAASAKASVIRALEEAPNFARAQELLLALVDGREP
ncbi:MAG: tetratricopeptide repeat protein [Gemmatimonadetes bacterium]|nr:tetratricopeptide repeat protein [Gemmatimonadota bacterium]